jgi:hypothetical protein
MFAEFNAVDCSSNPERIAEMVRLLSRFPTLFPSFPFGKPKGLRTFSKPKLYVAAAFLNTGIDTAEAYDRLLRLQVSLHPDAPIPVDLKVPISQQNRPIRIEFPCFE